MRIKNKLSLTVSLTITCLNLTFLLYRYDKKLTREKSKNKPRANQQKIKKIYLRNENTTKK